MVFVTQYKQQKQRQSVFRATTIAVSIAIAATIVALSASADEQKIASLPDDAATVNAAETTRQPQVEAAGLVSHLVMPPGANPEHPLWKVVRKMWAGEFGQQPPWRLALLLQGLKHEPRTARATAYSSFCCGGGTKTRWGTKPRPGICAADPRYWGPGSAIWVGEPVNSTLIVEDTGSAIKGPNRFDVCFGDDVAACYRFGVRDVQYVPLYRAPTKRRWPTKPADWTPPVQPIKLLLTTPKSDTRRLALTDARDKLNPG
jgi:3D (Asp-Asp-Asp) domain-containing protein